jgi:hypothetical protein
MKNLFIICLIAFLGSCKQNDVVVPTEFTVGEFGTITGLAVNALNLPRRDMALSIHAVKYTVCKPLVYDLKITHKTANSSAIVEKLGLSKLPFGKIGRFAIESNASSNCDTIVSSTFSVSDGGDVLSGIYFPLKKANNYVQIESFNTNTGEVTGTFDVTYREVTANTLAKSFYSDTIHFEKARFKLKVQ